MFQAPTVLSYLQICSYICSDNPSIDLCNFQTLAAIQFSICISVLLRLNCADHSTRPEIFWLLIDIALCNFINRLEISFTVFCGKRKYCVRALIASDQSDESWRKLIKRRASMVSLRAVVCGPLNCGKMNVLISLLESPWSMIRECARVLEIAATSISKYRYLANLLAQIEEIFYILQ